MQHSQNTNLWTVVEDGYSKEIASHLGTKFTIANGYMGYRGTLFNHGAKELVGCTLSGIYDRNQDSWREPVNAPNALYYQLYINQERLDLDSNLKSHSQVLDVQTSLLTQKTLFNTQSGEVTVSNERFASASNVHLLAQKTSIVAEFDCELVIKTGVDSDIWDLNGPHFKHISKEVSAHQTIFTGTTNEGDSVSLVEKSINLPSNYQDIDRLRQYKISLKAGESISFSKLVHIYTSKDADNSLELACQDNSLCNSFEESYEQHKKVWSNRWQNFDVVIEGDDRGQLALRYSIHQLLSCAPTHTDKVAIPARGLSAQVYKGAMFWDTEMHMSPMFNLTDPELAKNLLMYRYHGLRAAKQKADQFGYEGAYYPWEAQETGEEMCTFFNLTDVFSGRKVRTYFVDKQIHVNSAIIYAIWDYYNTSGDEEFLFEQGAEIFIECARLFYSYSYFKGNKDRYEILDVVGPDEYHERVHNNYYTNRMVKDSMEKTLRLIEILKSRNLFNQFAQRVGLTEEEVNTFIAFDQKLYVPEPNAAGVIEQHDNYFKLEDLLVGDLKKRVLNPNEHWGGAWGIAAETQVLKQADTVLALYLLREQYSQEVKKATWEYYEPRTDHGSSLSPCIYSLVACDIGLTDWAYEYFLKTAEIDINFGTTKQFAGTLFKGGTHPAANGGAYMSAIYGFAGITVKEDKLTINPKMPNHWKNLTFKVNYQGEQLSLTVNNSQVTVERNSTNTKPICIEVFGKSNNFDQFKLECVK